MGQALYRKYRPKSLEEVVGQEHVTQTLQNALKEGRLSHAYLFTGPRGVGKTSIARIWAHQINDLPYDDDSAHLDIIEIDAASNRRIDEIRDLRDKVYVAPAQAKYKVYIIDEVHMLTREAFNALLKTLEEPPEHVVFILATTDAHKLPETIVSRTQRFSFRPASVANLTALLKQISKTEKLNIGDQAIQLIAEHGNGSFRDSVSLLDQATSQGSRVEAEAITNLLGLPPAEAISQLARTVIEGSSPADLVNSLDELYNSGYQAAAIAKLLSQNIITELAKREATDGHLLELLDRLVEVPSSHDPERALEITLLRAAPYQALARVDVIEKASPTPVGPPLEPEPQTEVLVDPQPKLAKPVATKALNADLWPAVLQALKQKHNTLYGVVRMAQPDFSTEGRLTLAFAFSFHQKRLAENSNRQKLVDIVRELSGEVVNLECIVDKSAKPIKTSKAGKASPPEVETQDLAAISNIFGDAELLES